jgi:type 1 glutamine amidotransferase
MAKKALIVWGGWLGHEPEQVAEICERTLVNEGFSVEVSDTLESFEDVEKLKALHLIVPIWTMGEISREQVAAVSDAVSNGTGMAGCHGGMCDAFRTSVQWQFITGGNWVSHPGGDGVEYVVNVKQGSSPLVAGIKDFRVASEQYYLHVDPAIEVLATTRFPTVTWYHSSNGEVDVPVVWTKRWGVGRVYYNSLGHHADIFDIPEALELMRRGMLWAAEGKDLAIEQGLDASIYESDKKMF